MNITTYETKRFSTFTKGLRELSLWLRENHCEDVCMESTGKYWIPVFNVLEQTCKVTVAHPKYVKAIRGKKTDKKDAKWIADLFKHGLVATSFIPPLIIRELRDLMRCRFKLINLRSSEKARTQNSLTVSNIQIATVVLDTFGKSSQKIISRILENPLDTNFDVTPLVHRSMLAKVPDLQLAIDGFITPEQALKLSVIRKHMDSINDCLTLLESYVLELIKPFQKELDLMMTVPGIGLFSAIAIFAEIGADMSVFPTAKHLTSWAGLTPTNNESAGKKKSVRISRAGVYIKPLLVQCANAALKDQSHPEIRNRFSGVKRRRGGKRAIIAVARLLLTSIYHILDKQEPYNPELHAQAVYSPLEREITVEQAIQLAIRQGFSVVDSQSI